VTDAAPAADLARTCQRVAARLVGRERELTLTLAAVAAGRDIILEGPPGTSKSTILRAITAEWGIPFMFVEGNADLTLAKLVGHHNPARARAPVPRPARLARLGRGRLRLIRSYTGVAPALSAVFAG